jgi:tetratricopeptide (TPR) repeat protein
MAEVKNIFHRATELIHNKKYREALEALYNGLDLASTEQDWAPILYNIAVCQVHLDQKNLAVESLSQAVEAEMWLLDKIRKDKDFISLRNEPEYISLIEKRRTWSGLSERQISKAPYFIRGMEKIMGYMRRFRFYILLLFAVTVFMLFFCPPVIKDKVGEFFIALIALPISIIGFVILNIVSIHIGFLFDSLKKYELGYFFLLLIFGLFVWRLYINKVIKPDLPMLNKCPSCGKIIMIEAGRCRFCNEEFRSEKATLNQDNKDSPEEQWIDRTLCVDENCIGAIGPDGKCNVCGKCR